MFQNSYQNGSSFEVFDPKAPQEKNKNLYKLTNTQTNTKIFDKQLKTFIFEFSNPNSKITFPKQDKKQLSLIQQYLNLQLQLISNTDWSIQLTITDLTKIKRRVIISPTFQKLQRKPFFLKFPAPKISQAIWTYFCIDLHSFIKAFKGQTYRSLDSIQITGNFKLRRIFTTPSPALEENDESCLSLNLLPKHFYFPPQVETQRTMIQFLDTIESQKTISQEPIKIAPKIKTAKSMKQTTIIQNKNLAKLKEISQKSLQKGYQMQRKFLANTNGLQMRRNKNELQTQKVLNSREDNKSFKTVATERKQSSAKTKLPSKQRISIEKKTAVKQKQVQNNQKPNPWRSIKKAASINRYQSVTQNPKGVSNFESGLSRTGGLKSKATNIKSFDANNSSYAQLSQKFSTVTETRFFQNVLASATSNQVEQSKQNHDEIEQNIEIETNSFYESSDKKENKENEQNHRLIYESINDSLDEMQTKIQNHKKPKLMENESYFNTSSKFGFGEKMMNKFMEQVQRPYSPPLGERENTEEHEQTHNEVEDKEVELIYDPVLNCYYDHKTHTYYELKN